MKAISAGIFCFLLLLGGARAAEQRPQAFDIGAQGLSSALSEFAKQSQREIVFAPKVVKDKQTGGVKGTMEALSALSALLKDTGLTFSTTPAGAILVGDVQATQSSELVAQLTDLRFAQADQVMQKVEGDGNKNSKAAQDQKRAEGSDEAATADESSTDSSSYTKTGIPEILVKGRRTFNADIRRSEDDIQPYVIFSRADIESSAAINLEDFLKSRMPMNTVQQTFSQNATSGSTNGNQSQIDLRGLGAHQTLILVNGRRMPSVSTANREFGDGRFQGGDLRQTDINGIPLSMIERVEVLPATASGIYGGGATGGVVNIVLRQDYSGVEVSGIYRNTFDTDSAQTEFDINAGISLEGGRTQITLSASHFASNKLLIGDRDFVRRGRELMYRNDPTQFTSAYYPPFGQTSNIRSLSGNLILDDGTDLGSSVTYAPSGYAGSLAVADGGHAFVANAGQFNIGLPDSTRGNRGALVQAPQTRSVTASIRRRFTEGAEAFLDLSMFENGGRSRNGYSPLGQWTVAADSPNNPFQNTVFVNFPALDLETEASSDSDILRAGAGLILALPRSWTGTAEHSWSRSRYEDFRRVPSLNPSVAISTGQLDVMRDVNVFPVSYSGLIQGNSITHYEPADLTMNNSTLRLAGPLFGLPGGAVSLSVLAEHRKETVEDAFLVSYEEDLNGMHSDSFNFLYYSYPRSQVVDSTYAEFKVPLISQRQSISFAKALDLQLAVRRDAYETNSVNPRSAVAVTSKDAVPTSSVIQARLSSVDYTLGLRYAPIEDVVLRASYGTGFLPPALSQVVETPAFFPGLFVRDPMRSDVYEVVNLAIENQRQGGNPDLLPENSSSLSAGIILTPRFVPGLRLSLDYTRIRKTDEIGFIGAQDILNDEAAFPERISRASLSDEDIALGYTGGAITFIDYRMLNLTRSSVEALDIQANYTFETATLGAFRFYALGTRMMTSTRQISLNAPEPNLVGFNDGPLAWRINGGVDWSLGAWQLGWNGQYFDSQYVYPANIDPAYFDFFRDLYTGQQGSGSIPRQIYHDLFMRYRFGETPGFAYRVLAKTELMLGIQNVFDTEPPVVATTGESGGYSYVGDPRMRRYSLSLRRSF